MSKVEKALRHYPEVISAQVNLATRTASVRLQVKPGLVEKLVHGIKRAGYGARVIESLQDLSASSLSRNKALQNKRIVILALLFTIPVMVLGMSGIHSPWADYVQLFLLVVVVFGLGFPFFKNAFRLLSHRTASMDTLIALGSSSAFLFSLYGMGAGHRASLFLRPVT